jgi:hypothetical protein
MKIKLPEFLKRIPKESPQTELNKTYIDHVHDWELVAKTFVEPKSINIPESLELTQLCLTGMTTYLFQCTECKEFKKEEVSGVETTTLDKIIEKIDISGPEYIIKDGKTYIMMRYQNNQNQNIPIR